MEASCAPRIYSLERYMARNQETSDEELPKLIAGGDVRAMRSLFTGHGTRIYRFALRITGNSASAEDTVNDVFLQAGRQAHHFEALSSVSTWLLGVARHKAISSTRRRQDEHLDDGVASATEDPAGSPEDALCDHHRSAVIRRCHGRLTPVMREVIDFVYYHHKSVAEVAKIVAAAEKTIKMRMFYARKRLAELLANEGIHTAAAA